MNKKKLLLVLTVIVILFALSGCAIPTDENGKFILITADTTFKQMMQNEGIFSAIFVFPLSKMINYLAPATNVGVAIIAVTVVINVLATALTLRSNIAMQKMQMIQPELDRIQKKYEGRKDEASQMRQAQELQRIYKKHNVNPVGAMLSQFIQFPILIAMYHAVQRAQAVATGTFVGLSLETTPMAGIREGQMGYLVIFAIMIVAQFVSMQIPQWLQKQKAKKEAELHHRRYEAPKNPMGNTMYFMVIFIAVLMLNWPSAMSLYYCISSCVMIVKTLVVDKIAQAQKEKM